MSAAARLLLVVAILAQGAGTTPVQGASAPPQPGIVVPYEPTPDNVVEGMLALGEVGPQDFLIDLGSGDGRIVVAAARNHGARARGIELNPDLVRRSIANAEAAGVSDRVEFRQQDIFTTDLARATVITMFLYRQINLKLRPKLLDLRPGTRIVSHFHDMAEWRPDQSRKLATKEHYGDTWIFLWTVPAKVAGAWRWREPRAGTDQAHVLMLDQAFQEVSGTLATESLRPIEIRDGKLHGAQLTFWAPIREGGRTLRWDFQGQVEGGTITGIERSAAATGATEQPWRATRE